MPPPWLLRAVFLLWGAAITHAFTFSSPEGFTLVRKILLSALPTFEPHSYQMEGVCKVLDKIYLVAVTPTGSQAGKTGFLFLTILVMIAIAADPSLCPTVTFPKDPAIVVVCPTNSIEQQMDENMGKLACRAVHSHIVHTGGAGCGAVVRVAGKDATWFSVNAVRRVMAKSRGRQPDVTFSIRKSLPD
ncbi:hypothetical protein GGX14DRAFT_400644 [Mycena pura]|uniref:DEAD/DEAH box helicase domain-containing protein n=1 Tax=Mycena pura TaxID=153505 RepID=A0AAD6V164_9AGAR|nr:hypothetical protein GGX14DRAFT_400644 [Mycena pura]